MQRTVNEGHDFINEMGPLKKKRVHKERVLLAITLPSSKKVRRHRARAIIAAAPLRKAAPASKPRKIRKAAASTAAAAGAPVAAAVAPAPAAKTSSILSSGSQKAVKMKSARPDLPLPAYGFVDICFCIDATGSMCSYLAQAQQTVIQIIEKIQNKVRAEGITLRFAVVTYRDHPPQDSTYVTKFQDFTDEHEIINYVKSLSAAGGGDYPEAVHDGLKVCCQDLNWAEIAGTPTLRYVFHVADAPPHGSEFDQGTKEGCLCGLQTKDVLNMLNRKMIHYRLIKASSGAGMDKFEAIFKKGIVDFASASITSATEMDIRISDMVMLEILPDYA